MITREFKEKELSLLGFGAMRLPQLAEGGVDEALVEKMVQYAMEHGVNYYDTAYPYHNGESERVMGRILGKYPRESFYLADKFPGHQIMESYNPAELFEEQLRRCGVDYFDFYLLHNVYEKSIETYMDPKWGIIDYFKEQKRLGRIKHLGFSTHAALPTLERFLTLYGEDMEFCQIQLNYLDWTLQNAKEKCVLLAKHNIPVWVMEPVRGGKLAKLDEQNEKTLKEFRPEESVPAWGFRFLQGLPNVKMILSGMSDMKQMEDNVKTFSEEKPLSEEEQALLFDIAEGLKDSIPCTSCRYCTSVCPMGLDIPNLISSYNEIRFAPVTNSIMWIEALPVDKKPSACVSCGQCMRVCPQNIQIPKAMREFDAAMKKIPSWEQTCREREAAQRKCEK